MSQRTLQSIVCTVSPLRVVAINNISVYSYGARDQ